ncbi:MAG: serine/threonine protein kinase [Polyangiaceae bacterium]|nr:serine/threonine protein kinase [Polyangiaceae bacterium]
MSEDESTETPETVPSGTVIGHYRVVRRLGIGGMGEVYLVQHTGTDEMFAMKVLLSQTISDTTALERFRREARTPARIESEHVVKVTHVDVAPELKGSPYLVMEYLRGEDLDRHVERHGRMQAREVVSFLQQIARALDKAHAKGIVHRDLKPENVFITRREDGTAHLKILDFGIAKFTSGAGDMISKTATSPGQIYGTPLYMAPEQAKGESKKICPQTDIWALGLITNRMLSGRDYWDAETLTALIAQVVYEPMQKPSEKSKDFAFGDKYDAWFLRCCDRDPDARFGTAGEAVFRLGQALGVIDADAPFSGQPSSLVAAPPPSLRPATEPRPLSKTELQLAQTGLSATNRSDRGTVMKVVGGIAAVGLLIGAVVFAMRAGEKDKPQPAAATDAKPGVTATAKPLPRANATAGVNTATVVTPADATASATASSSAAVSPSTSADASAAVSATAAPATGEPKVIGARPTAKPKTSATTAAPPPSTTTKPTATGSPLDGRL